MSTQNQSEQLFIQASRKQLRFETPKGLLSVEDLWSRNLEFLDSIAVALDEKIQKLGKKSFINKRTTGATEAELALEIVKYVISVKQDEAEASKVRAEKAAKKAHILQILEEKENDALKGKSLDELKKLLEETEK